MTDMRIAAIIDQARTVVLQLGHEISAKSRERDQHHLYDDGTVMVILHPTTMYLYWREPGASWERVIDAVWDAQTGWQAQSWPTPPISTAIQRHLTTLEYGDQADAANYRQGEAITYGNAMEQLAMEAERQAAAARTKVQCYEVLLRRLLQWDHLDGSADGPYWRREIEWALVIPTSPDTSPDGGAGEA